MNIEIFIFSYNRGKFLRNCIESIEECCPVFPVTIIDDNSSEPFTNQVLNKLAVNYKVIRHNPDRVEQKTGGLYGNMNKAMEIAKYNEVDYALFLQDDMQMVRPFILQDTSNLRAYFKSNQNSIQCETNFIRSLSTNNFFGKHSIDESGTAYIRKKEHEKGKTNFCATGVFHVKRFFELFGNFEIGEGINSEKARSLGLVKGISAYPFMNWLPYPLSFRGKKRVWIHEFTELIGGSGYHPIHIMSENKIKEFLERDTGEIPVMERYLISPSSPRKDQWSTGGGEYNVIARGGIPAKTLSALKQIKQFFFHKQRT